MQVFSKWDRFEVRVEPEPLRSVTLSALDVTSSNRRTPGPMAFETRLAACSMGVADVQSSTRSHFLLCFRPITIFVDPEGQHVV